MNIIMPIFFIGLAFFIIFRIATKDHREQIKKIKACNAIIEANNGEMIYSFKEIDIFGVLFVPKKSPHSLEALVFEEERGIHVTDTPDKLVYTGATVGGIHTGGFHVQKGGISVSKGAGTGEWGIRYRFATYSVTAGGYSESSVDFIQLKDNLFAVAKKDAILNKLIITDEERKEWREHPFKKDLADIPCLMRVSGMDQKTANHLKYWLADRA